MKSYFVPPLVYFLPRTANKIAFEEKLASCIFLHRGKRELRITCDTTMNDHDYHHIKILFKNFYRNCKGRKFLQQNYLQKVEILQKTFKRMTRSRTFGGT